MTLFVDKIIENDLGGYTTDLKKAEYILAVHGLTFEKILSQTPRNIKNPGGGFISGKYVVMFNIPWGLKSVNIGFINHEIDLDRHFDVFADCKSPKSVAGFHQFREKIKQKGQSELDETQLSENDSDFVVAYGNYIEYRNSQ